MKRLNRSVSASLLACTLIGGQSAASTAVASTTSATYIVVYRQSVVPPDASASVARAGGSLVQAYNDIGVAIATSSSTQFRQSLASDTRVQGIGLSSSAIGRVNVPQTEPGLTPRALAAPAPATAAVPNAARALRVLTILRELPNRSRARRLRLVPVVVPGHGQAAPGLAPSTVNHIISTVSAFYEYLILAGEWTTIENPIMKVPGHDRARVSDGGIAPCSC